MEFGLGIKARPHLSMTQQIRVSDTGAYYDWDLSAARVTLAGGAGYAFGLNVPTEPSSNDVRWDYRQPIATQPSSAVGFVSVGMVSSVSGSWFPPITTGNPVFSTQSHAGRAGPAARYAGPDALWCRRAAPPSPDTRLSLVRPLPHRAYGFPPGATPRPRRNDPGAMPNCRRKAVMKWFTWE